MAVQDGNLEKIATRLVEIEAAEKTRAQLLGSVHESLSENLGKRFHSDEAEITRLGGLIQATISDTDAKLKYLESTINNLQVTTENLSASESRIRDTDMATEMVNFTKNQILLQAGTAMLGQANAVPQSVLSLLQ